MRSYWVKIVLGALAIFVVGYVGVSVVKSQVHRVRQFSESNSPITIPLAFIPFELEGDRAGTFSGIRIERHTPKSIASFHIRVKLGDSVDVEYLKSCRLYLEQTGRDFDPDDEFACLEPSESDSGKVQFGDVTFLADNDVEFTVPLLLDAATVDDLRNVDDAEEVTARAVAESEAAAARAEADRIRVEVQTEVDRAVAKVRHRRPATPKPPPPPQ